MGLSERRGHCWWCRQWVTVQQDGMFEVDAAPGQYRGMFDAWRFVAHAGRRRLWCPGSGELARVSYLEGETG